MNQHIEGQDIPDSQSLSLVQIDQVGLPPFPSHIANLRKGQNAHIRELSWSLERVHQDHFLLLANCKWIKRFAPPFIHQAFTLELFCQVCSSIYTTKEKSCNTIRRHKLKELHNVKTCSEIQNKIQLPEKLNSSFDLRGDELWPHFLRRFI